MDHFHDFLRQHFKTLYFAGLVWVIVNLLWRFFRDRHSGVVFPPMESVHPRFHENMASGNSDKSWRTRLGGASRCLRVTVTDDEIWVRPFFPFSLLAADFDLKHRIPRTAVISAQFTRSRFRRAVALDFNDESGGKRHLLLSLRNPEAFLAVLNAPTPPPLL